MYHTASRTACAWNKHRNARQGRAGRPSDSRLPQKSGHAEAWKRTSSSPWNDADVLAETIARHGDLDPHDRADRTGHVQHQLHPAQARISGAMRELTAKRGIVLIFDEVVTGFRLGLAGAQGRLGITPDLSVFAKGIGGGSVADDGRTPTYGAGRQRLLMSTGTTAPTASRSRRRTPPSTGCVRRACTKASTRCPTRCATVWKRC